MTGLAERLLRMLRVGRQVETQARPRGRAPATHVILLDGTASTLVPGCETNIGLIYKLLKAAPASARLSLYYEAGMQWHLWRDTANVAMGRGINRQIRRAYGWLATRYRPGDRIFFFGYSRGAFAVRSLAGVIDQVGLLKAEHATERNVRLAYRYYRREPGSPGEAVFRKRFSHDGVAIEMIGAFDTVKALGLRLPLLWMWTEPQNDFHNHHLSPVVKAGFHALALDETRAVFEPILWDSRTGDWKGRLEQMWFRGAHGDVGGQLGEFRAARPLANIPLVWMLDKAAGSGLDLPEGWQADLPGDPAAPAVGTLRGWGKAFLFRARRKVGRDPSEAIHPSVASAPLRRRGSPPALPVRPLAKPGRPA